MFFQEFFGHFTVKEQNTLIPIQNSDIMWLKKNKETTTYPHP